MDWEYILNLFYQLKPLENIEQNSLYHGEGNVLNHTKMVCEELIQFDEFKTLNRFEKKVLFLAALFHDIGKLKCTTIEDNQIVSPKHAIKGHLITRAIFYKFFKDIDFKMRENIINLIRYHGLPTFFLQKDNSEKKLFETSQTTNIYHLYLLAKADCIGRLCSDKKNLLDNIELFKYYALENNCFYTPKSFPNDLSRFEYFRKQSRDINFEAYDNTVCEVILLCGLPATGKDTWIAENNLNLPVISLDKLRKSMNISPKDNQSKIIYVAKEQAKAYLRSKQSFIWNATNITKNTRQNLIDLFISYKAKPKIVYIETPYNELIKRNENRKEYVPINVINNMIDKLEIPSPIESCSIEYILNKI